MNPNNQWNAAAMGVALTSLGQAEEGLAWFTRAKEIDPLFDPPWYWRAVGEAHMSLHRYREALAAFEYLPGRSWRLAAHIAARYGRLGDGDRARASTAECLVLKPDFAISWLIAKQPFKNPADAANLVESLRLAGLPH